MEYKHSELTGKIIGAAMEVHGILGNGYPEITYQRALSIELELRGIAHVCELDMPLSYKGRSIGSRRVDLFVEDTVMVELKAVIELEDGHLAQAINYLECSGLDVGLLLNFGSRSLEYKRVMQPFGRTAKPAGTLPNK
jgi:GxxExxY protein